jgi:hypothetical protein
MVIIIIVNYKRRFSSADESKFSFVVLDNFNITGNSLAVINGFVGYVTRRAPYLKRIMEPAERHTNGDDYKFFIYQTRVGVPM